MIWFITILRPSWLGEKTGSFILQSKWLDRCSAIKTDFEGVIKFSSLRLLLLWCIQDTSESDIVWYEQVMCLFMIIDVLTEICNRSDFTALRQDKKLLVRWYLLKLVHCLWELLLIDFRPIGDWLCLGSTIDWSIVLSDGLEQGLFVACGWHYAKLLDSFRRSTVRNLRRGGCCNGLVQQSGWWAVSVWEPIPLWTQRMWLIVIVTKRSLPSMHALNPLSRSRSKHSCCPCSLSEVIACEISRFLQSYGCVLIDKVQVRVAWVAVLSTIQLS